MSRPPRRAQSPSQTHPLLQGVIANWHSRPGGAWSALPDAPVHADEPPRWTRTSTLLNRIRSRAWNRDETADDRAGDAGPGVVIANDTEFEPLLAVRQLPEPSLIVRSSDQLTTHDIARTLLSNLDAIAAELKSGAIVTLHRGQLRARRPHPPR
jgi:predicted nuclease of predicted toxin-antitoxin system